MSFANITIAVKDGTLEDVRNFLEQKKPDADAMGNALCFATFDGNVEAAELLISHGANVKIKSRFEIDGVTGFTPLHMVTKVEIAEMLISAGAEIEAKTSNGNSTLYDAVMNGRNEVAKFLISKDAKVNEPNKDGITALHIAATNGNVEIVEALVSKKANVNAQAYNGFTPLHAAAGYDHIKIIEILCSSQADLNIKDKEGHTPLLTAKLIKKMAAVECLSNIISQRSKLQKNLQELQTKVESNGEYTIIVTNNESICPQKISFLDKNNVTVRLVGEGEKIISLADTGSLFEIESDVTLILDKGITLQGHHENDKSLITINNGGTLKMNAGTKIKDNYSHSTGGGVSVNGTFIMNGGEISGNSAATVGNAGAFCSGAGVIVFKDGVFTMTGGKISNNTASGTGGSVWCGGIFNMEGGEISDNQCSEGGGVTSFGGTFTMTGGEIVRNKATSGHGGGVFVYSNFIMKGGKISDNSTNECGGGVFISGLTKQSHFTMNGGEISGNIASKYGGGVFIHKSGVFEKSGGEIFGNKASEFNDVADNNQSTSSDSSGNKTKPSSNASGCGCIIVIIAVVAFVIYYCSSGNEKNNKIASAPQEESIAASQSKPIKSVQIGNQTWMAENLNDVSKGGKCHDDNPSNCEKYGRLYTWEEAKKACPEGWHLPSDAEWTTLIKFAGGDKTAGRKLKAKNGWSNNGNGTDDYGFSLTGDGEYSRLWSSTEHNANNAWRRRLDHDRGNVLRDNQPKIHPYSVRCVQNLP